MSGPISSGLGNIGHGSPDRWPDRSGSFLWGLVQPLGLYLATLVLFGGIQAGRIRQGRYASLWHLESGVLMAVFVLSILIGAGYRHGRRFRTAAGVFTGAVIWPVIGGIALMFAIAYAMSHARIPF